MSTTVGNHQRVDSRTYDKNDRAEQDKRSLPARVTAGVRLLAAGGLLIAAISIGGHFLSWPLLTAPLGPTAYLLLAHPNSESAKLRNAVVGHVTAVAAALAAIAMFGIWHTHTTAHDPPSLLHSGASAVALGLTLLVLEIADTHHAPAAATTLLIASGLAEPTRPLLGLLIGLGMLLVGAPILAKTPPFRLSSPPDQLS